MKKKLKSLPCVASEKVVRMDAARKAMQTALAGRRCCPRFRAQTPLQQRAGQKGWRSLPGRNERGKYITNV